MGEPEQGIKFSQLLELVKVLIWPLLIIGFFSLFYSPLSASIRLLPEKLRESKKISIGSLSLEIQEVVVQKGDSRAAASLRKLPQPAIQLLLNTGHMPSRLVTTNDKDVNEMVILNLEAISALVDAGLLHIYKDQESEYKDYSLYTLQSLLKEITGPNDDEVLDELMRRGYNGIVTEVIRAKSKVALEQVVGLNWKEKDVGMHQLMKIATAKEREELLNINFELSPSGCALYDAMVTVVSERISSGEKEKLREQNPQFHDMKNTEVPEVTEGSALDKRQK